MERPGLRTRPPHYHSHCSQGQTGCCSPWAQSWMYRKVSKGWRALETPPLSPHTLYDQEKKTSREALLLAAKTMSPNDPMR